MAVEGLREKAGRGRLPNTSSTGEDVGVMQALVLDRVAERTRNVVLARDLFKSLGPPFSSDYLIRHLSSEKRDAYRRMGPEE